MTEVDWITKEQLEIAKNQAKEIYKEFLQDDSQGEQSWDEIEIDEKFFDIECWDDTGTKREDTFCSIYPTYPINGWRETDSEKWLRLFTTEKNQ